MIIITAKMALRSQWDKIITKSHEGEITMTNWKAKLPMRSQKGTISIRSQGGKITTRSHESEIAMPNWKVKLTQK